MDRASIHTFSMDFPSFKRFSGPIFHAKPGFSHRFPWVQLRFQSKTRSKGVIKRRFWATDLFFNRAPASWYTFLCPFVIWAAFDFHMMYLSRWLSLHNTKP